MVLGVPILKHFRVGHIDLYFMVSDFALYFEDYLM